MKKQFILVTQPENSPNKILFNDYSRHYDIEFYFRPFFEASIIDTKVFRQQKVVITDYNCVILKSKKIADYFFEMTKNMRLQLNSEFKYFCYSQNVALYLQKHITYKKRKIFVGQNSIASLEEDITKNKHDRFIVPSSNNKKDEITKILDKLKIQYVKPIFFRRSYADLKDLELNKYSIIIFYTPSDIESFVHNFPDYKKQTHIFGCLGKQCEQAIIKKGFKVKIKAGFGKYPSSIIQAIQNYLDKNK